MKSFVDTTELSDTCAAGGMLSSGHHVLPTTASHVTRVKRISTTPILEKLARGVTSTVRLLPDFLIIGAQRSGTTSLYNYLQALSCIGPASTKEVHFFDRRFHRGLSWYRGHFPTRIEKYYAQYLQEQQAFLTGEATPCYLFYPHAPERVGKMLPNVKLIVLLRNPVDRAYSQYYHAIELGFATLSFEEAIEREEERAAREREKILKDGRYYSVEYMERGYLSRGVYVDQLQVWMSLLPREQFLILKSEDFYADPATSLRQVLTFLNVPEQKIQMEKKAYKQYNNYSYTKMDPALRNRLIAYFEPHNARLYDYLGVNFDWDK
jgi:hypothetical protein